MKSKQILGKGILAKLLEKGIRILIIKECKKISNLQIDIISSSTQIIRGEIQTVNIIAEDINYKDLLFDQLELEANQLQINLNLINKKLYFKNNPLIKFKISLSQNSLRNVLLHNKWDWIGNMISQKILSQEKLKDIKIKNDALLIKAFENNITTNQEEHINITTSKGKVYLLNKNYEERIQIPIEDKIYVEKINIKNNLINIYGNSTISF